MRIERIACRRHLKSEADRSRFYANLERVKRAYGSPLVERILSQAPDKVVRGLVEYATNSEEAGKRGTREVTIDDFLSTVQTLAALAPKDYLPGLLLRDPGSFFNTYVNEDVVRKYISEPFGGSPVRLAETEALKEELSGCLPLRFLMQNLLLRRDFFAMVALFQFVDECGRNEHGELNFWVVYRELEEYFSETGLLSTIMSGRDPGWIFRMALQRGRLIEFWEGEFTGGMNAGKLCRAINADAYYPEEIGGVRTESLRGQGRGADGVWGHYDYLTPLVQEGYLDENGRILSNLDGVRANLKLPGPCGSGGDIDDVFVQLQRAFFDGLNQLLGRRDFYEKWRGKNKEMPLTDEMSALVEQTMNCRSRESWQTGERPALRRLNRLLIEITYPDLCPRVQEARDSQGRLKFLEFMRLLETSFTREQVIYSAQWVHLGRFWPEIQINGSHWEWWVRQISLRFNESVSKEVRLGKVSAEESRRLAEELEEEIDETCRAAIVEPEKTEPLAVITASEFIIRLAKDIANSVQHPPTQVVQVDFGDIRGGRTDVDVVLDEDHVGEEYYAHRKDNRPDYPKGAAFRLNTDGAAIYCFTSKPFRSKEEDYETATTHAGTSGWVTCRVIKDGLATLARFAISPHFPDLKGTLFEDPASEEGLLWLAPEDPPEEEAELQEVYDLMRKFLKTLAQTGQVNLQKQVALHLPAGFLATQGIEVGRALVLGSFI